MKRISLIFLIITLAFVLSACNITSTSDKTIKTIEGIELDGELSSREVGPYIFIDGNLKNTTSKDVTDYAVVVEVYNEQGDFVIVASKMNQELIEANDTKYFDVRFKKQDFDLEKTKVYVITQEQYNERYGQ